MGIYKKSGMERVRIWTRIAWYLERMYPTQFCKPEVQLADHNNTLNQTVNNTLVVTAEVAGAMADRVRPIEARVEKLFKNKGNGNGHHLPEAKEI